LGVGLTSGATDQRRPVGWAKRSVPTIQDDDAD
jgi:hypothetical protein